MGRINKATVSETFWHMVDASPAAFPNLGILGSIRNLTAVTAGNILGGAVLVAGVYWLLYRRAVDEQQLTEARVMPGQNRKQI